MVDEKIIYKVDIFKIEVEFLVDIKVKINDGIVIISDFVIVVDFFKLGKYVVILNVENDL